MTARGGVGSACLAVPYPAALVHGGGERSGLGLLIVARISGLHGRKIRLLDSPREALFVFELLRVDDAGRTAD